MARLPHADAAQVADAKLTQYLLNPLHPRGDSKATFFLRHGYRQDRPETLRAALLLLAQGDGFEIEPDRFGLMVFGDW